MVLEIETMTLFRSWISSFTRRKRRLNLLSQRNPQRGKSCRHLKLKKRWYFLLRTSYCSWVIWTIALMVTSHRYWRRWSRTALIYSSRAISCRSRVHWATSLSSLLKVKLPLHQLSSVRLMTILNSEWSATQHGQIVSSCTALSQVGWRLNLMTHTTS